jgi:hypothetical protein
VVHSSRFCRRSHAADTPRSRTAQVTPWHARVRTAAWRRELLATGGAQVGEGCAGLCHMRGTAAPTCPVRCRHAAAGPGTCRHCFLRQAWCQDQLAGGCYACRSPVHAAGFARPRVRSSPCELRSPAGACGAAPVSRSRSWRRPRQRRCWQLLASGAVSKTAQLLSVHLQKASGKAPQPPWLQQCALNLVCCKHFWVQQRARRDNQHVGGCSAARVRSGRGSSQAP